MRSSPPTAPKPSPAGSPTTVSTAAASAPRATANPVPSPPTATNPAAPKTAASNSSASSFHHPRRGGVYPALSAKNIGVYPQKANPKRSLQPRESNHSFFTRLQCRRNLRKRRTRYPRTAQIHRNNFPHRASELLNNEFYGRPTW